MLTDSDAIRRAALDGQRRRRRDRRDRWMHTFSPAKMWIAGLDALQKPLLHLHTQANVELPWADDRLRLHEPQPGRARRPGVRVHRDPARRRPQDRRRARHATRAVTRLDRHLGARARRLGGDAVALKLARFGDNMRYVAVTEGDKTEAEIRFGVSVNTWGVNDLVDCGRRRPPTPRSTRWSSEYEDRYDVVRRTRAPAASGTSRCATAPRSSSACAPSSRRGGFGAFTTTFEDLGALRQLPGLAVQRLMADGYGFGAEGDWKTAILRARRERDGRRPARRCLAHGGLHLRPDARRGADPRRAHARGQPDPDHDAGRRLEIHPLGIGGQRGPGPAGLHRRPRPRASSSRSSDMRDRFRLTANVVDVVAPARAAAEPARRPRGLEARPDFRTSRRRLARPPAPPTTP